ncbi:beta-galactosidase [Bifidobacterium goeldii]|uniref:Beta-galactosidase n=1 Tax=Bifidobacterium goeldii TaxID=2306975 RepID=A0A430FJ20_9BIFI|nr:beta-galactosidase [Bifidobacterium goeldii]RSX52883.1 beta-galactosidase [Bifidobacterium goeldii]
MTAAINHILFGAAYYDEYMPYDRLDKDIAMMKAAHMNVVRIAESTWSTMEPQPGTFDFSHIDRVLDAMHNAGISVIVGTPTYAVPSWLVAADPDVLARTHRGEGHYGPRQIMDITNKTYLFHAEKAIRALIEHVAEHPAVIGYQVDNETKHYDSVSRTMQQAFVRHLRERFNDDLDALNRAFGLDYWSNRINAWEDFPDVTHTINGSLAGAFDTFRRHVAADFLGWQAGIVREYARDDQFVTQNFDLEWRGYSFGLQQWTDMFRAASYLDIAGIDIYHPTESELTGREIAFGSDLTRSLKGGNNYLLLETQAQGQNGWLPYPGQLRLQGYSHLANGSDSVMYWHWHSLHNSYETYWRGVLSQDFEPNPTYQEAATLGAELEAISSDIVNLTKHNRIAIMVSHEALTTLARFTIETGFPDPDVHNHHQVLRGYNDVLRWIYDALFDLNIECDFVTTSADADTLARYDAIITPALYVTDESCITRLREYVAHGGHLISTFKSFFTNESVKVWTDQQPHQLTDVFGMHYSQFTRPRNVDVRFAPDSLADSTTNTAHADLFMELLNANDCEVLAAYDHPAWKDYAAVTAHQFGSGKAWWIGTMFDAATLRSLLSAIFKEIGLWAWPQELAGRLTVRRGVNEQGADITYLLNYSDQPVAINSPVEGLDLLAYAHQEPKSTIHQHDSLTVDPWGVMIIRS